jgi:hypothetical protein
LFSPKIIKIIKIIKKTTKPFFYLNSIQIMADKKAAEYWVWRFGTDVRIYRLAAENEDHARELVEKYPYQPHRVIASKREPSSEIIFKVEKVPENVEEILKGIFGKNRKRN